MPEQKARQLYIVEGARRRVAISALDAGKARTLAAVLLLGGAQAPARDSLVVREPEDEEWAAFMQHAQVFGRDSACSLAAIPL